jgi:type II secretory pathway pseudopilin PulG
MLLNILVALALLAVLGTLLFGVFTMARGGDDARKSNKLMQYRVMLQGAALVLLLVLMSMLRG